MSDGMIILIIVLVWLFLSLIALVVNIKAKPRKIEKGRIEELHPPLFMHNFHNISPVRMIAMHLAEKQEQEELEEEEAQQRVIDAIVTHNKRDYRQDLKTGRIWICPNCRKKNEKYVTTCICGTPKPVK